VSLGSHQVTTRLVADIAAGRGGAAGRAALVASQRSKCMVLLRLIVDLAASGRHPEAALAADGYRTLARVQRLAPEATEQVLRHPATGSWALHAVLGLRVPASPDSAPGPAPGRLAAVAAAAAIRSGITCDIRLPAAADHDGRVELPSLGAAVLPPALRGHDLVLWCRDGTAELRGPRDAMTLPARLDTDSPSWQPIVTLTAATESAGVSVRLDDADSYRLTGYSGRLARLAPAERADWRRALRGGWPVLARQHPETAADVAALITALVPLHPVPDAQVSVSSRRAFGGVGLSLPADDQAMALTLTHEVQHLKLSALMDLFPMVTTDAAGSYYVPWRNDPRPLASLLQGVYAHLGVASFWRRQRLVLHEPAEVFYAHTEFARWRAACAQAVAFLASRPELTPCGTVFVSSMARLAASWRSDPVPLAAGSLADRLALEHRRQWARRHGRATQW
jgi:uncharacterized protein